MGKEKLSTINLKVPPRTHADFRIAAKLRGGTMSSLLHQYIVRIIREEKERDPEAFNTPPKKSLKSAVGAERIPGGRKDKHSLPDEEAA
jgi:hypothetical protein